MENVGSPGESVKRRQLSRASNIFMIRIQWYLVKYKVRGTAVTQKSEPLTTRSTGGNPGSIW